MFESLSEKLQDAFRKLSSKGRISESDISRTLRDVRLALLEADVNYRVVKDFTRRIGERAAGDEVARSLTPAQTVIKIVHQELVTLLGGPGRLDLGGKPPAAIMLVGLYGSGKTTTAAKLAVHLRRDGQRPLLVAADTHRPAAISQLVTLGRQIDVPVYSEGDRPRPPGSGKAASSICANALKHAGREGYTVAVFDSAGRLQIDDDMMGELDKIHQAIKPQEVLLVADAMTGQEAVAVAEEFNRRVGLTGLILTKVDGDARGGAALSIRAVTGVPIKFMGVGERTSDLEVFYPDRLASRILGMGDVLTIIERAEGAFSQEQALKMGEKLRTASFTLEDFVDQLQTVKKMGPLGELLGMIPGLQQLARELPAGATERGLIVTEAIINSMTRQERHNPRVIDASRKRRIARGSGTSVQQVNQLLRQFAQMQQMIKQLQSGRGRGIMSMLR
ncbi:MAG TPA: signal recognition particle protein [Anaerolineae bacterium]|nr:signal recognition particle protein [Anaerolineae bacterium]